MKEFLSLVYLRISVALSSFWEQIKVTSRYYFSFPTFAKWDLKLLSLSFLNNPFKLSRNFHQNRGDEEVYVYGETPLTLLDSIMKEAKVAEKDVVFDLGAGRGRGCFWLRGVIGCEAVGIEFVPEFVQAANQVVSEYKIDRLRFILEDMTQSDLNSGTVFYIYGNFLSDALLTKVAKKLEKITHPVKVISVSFPFTDYSNKFEVVKCFPMHFPWGWADVYLSHKL